MLDFLLCQSAEKLVIDAEAIGMAQRLLRGIGTPTETLATGMFAVAGLDGRFPRARRRRGGSSAASSTCRRKSSIVARTGPGSTPAASTPSAGPAPGWTSCWQPTSGRTLAPEVEAGLIDLVRREAERAGMTNLPGS